MAIYSMENLQNLRAQQSNPKRCLTRSETFGKILKYYRLRNCLTQKQMAKKLKMPYQNYQRYEYGIYKPKPKRLNKICGTFNIESAKLIQEFYL